MKVVIKEFEENPLQGQTPTNEYVFDEETKKVTRIRRPSWLDYLSSSPWSVMKELFLPIGYPHSVDSSYLPYQLYDGLQGLCSYWRGVVSTKAVLEASGVGDAQATAFSAAMNWALRDGTGMIGGLVFSYMASHYFDIYVKEFRLFADVINDVALTLDMVAPLYPHYSLYVLALSTICKTMCGMSAGATKGRITHHFAGPNGNNMADLTAKESTQETLVSLLGMMGGVYVAHLLEKAGDPTVTWTLFLFLTVIHVWANYKGVMLLKLSTLNPARTQVLLTGVLEALVMDSSPTTTERILKTLPRPHEVSESLLSSTYSIFFPTIRTAVPLDPSQLLSLEVFQDELYILGYNHRKRQIYAHLRVGATKSDELQAYVHALLLKACLDTTAGKWERDLVKRTLEQLNVLFESSSSNKKNNNNNNNSLLLRHLEQQGWDLQSRLYLGFSSHRIEWSYLKED